MNSNKRYQWHGGVATVIGEFTPGELYRHLSSMGQGTVIPALKAAVRAAHHRPGEVMDMALPNNRELHAYLTDADYIRLVLVNH